MSSAGDERPPERPDDSDAPEEDVPDADAPEAAAGDDQPAYTVYGAGGETRKQKAPKRKAKAKASSKDKPDYKVYKSRPGLRDRVRKPDLAGVRKSRRSGGLGDRGEGPKRHWLRWILIAIGAWIAISFIAFAVSAQIQKGKLPDGTKEALAGGPDLLAGQNILI